MFSKGSHLTLRWLEFGKNPQLFLRIKKQHDTDTTVTSYTWPLTHKTTCILPMGGQGTEPRPGAMGTAVRHTGCMVGYHGNAVASGITCWRLLVHQIFWHFRVQHKAVWVFMNKSAFLLDRIYSSLFKKEKITIQYMIFVSNMNRPTPETQFCFLTLQFVQRYRYSKQVGSM